MYEIEEIALLILSLLFMKRKHDNRKKYKMLHASIISGTMFMCSNAQEQWRLSLFRVISTDFLRICAEYAQLRLCLGRNRTILTDYAI